METYNDFINVGVGGELQLYSSESFFSGGTSEMLLTDATEIQEWGVSGQLPYDSDGDRLGMLLDLSTAWGQSSATKDSVLWSRSVLAHDFNSSMYTNGAKIGAEIGYGIELWKGASDFTPLGGLALTRNDDDEYSLGSKLSIGSNIEFELEGSRTYQENGTTANEVNLDSKIKW